jgi:hypothetical protein
LEQAKEKPSARMFAYTLLDKLLPQYKPAVLALKAGGSLKDADKINWEAVTALLNAHERNEQRLGSEGPQGKAMAAKTPWKNPSSGSATRDHRDSHALSKGSKEPPAEESLR